MSALLPSDKGRNHKKGKYCGCSSYSGGHLAAAAGRLFAGGSGAVVLAQHPVDPARLHSGHHSRRLCHCLALSSRVVLPGRSFSAQRRKSGLLRLRPIFAGKRCAISRLHAGKTVAQLRLRKHSRSADATPAAVLHFPGRFLLVCSGIPFTDTVKRNRCSRLR